MVTTEVIERPDNAIDETMRIPEEMKAKREAYWDELSLDQKLERARGIIKTLEEEVRLLKAGHEKLNWQFKKHSHDVNGVVTLPLDEAEMMLGSGLIPGRFLNGNYPKSAEESKFF